MKIKKQITLLIIGIIIIPTVCLASIPLLLYFNTPRHYLMNGYNELRKLESLQLTESNWNELKTHLTRIPPEVELIFFYKGEIHLSTVKELPVGTKLDMKDLYTFINTASDVYDFQIKTIFPSEKDELNNKIIKTKGVIITRVKVDSKPKRLLGLHDLFFITMTTIVIFTVTFVIYISHSISNSITFLEQATKKIADGDLETAILPPKKRSISNEITSLSKNLEKLRQSLKDEESRRIRFVMGISHDLRTPVALIKGYTEAISDGIVTDIDDIKHSLSIIHTKSEQLESLINDLINYVKLNNRDWCHNLEKTAIAPLLKEFSQYMKFTGDVYKRKISIELSIDEEIMIPLDKTLFNRALENLFSNALRYTEENDTIGLTAIQESDRILLSIADTGKGIEKEDIDHIYDLFYRGTSSRREQGYGIGLSVVKTFIDSMNWKISVESEPCMGTEFTITIPLDSYKNQK